MKINIPLKWQLILFAIIHVLIFAVVFNLPFWGQRNSAAGLFYNYASYALQGHVLYLDFPIEYPPLAELFFVLPRLVTSNANLYAIAFGVELFLFDLLGLFLITKLARRINHSSMSVLTMYTLALLAIGPLMVDRYDLIPAVLTLLAIYAFCYGKQKIAWGLLAIGTMTKLYPVVIAPVFLLYGLRQKQYRQVFLGVITFAIVFAIIAVPFLVMAPTGFLASFGYHAERGQQLETTYASILLILHNLGLVSVTTAFDFGSWNLVSPTADTMARLSSLFLLLTLSLAYWRFFRTQKAVAVQNPDADMDKFKVGSLINSTFLTVLAVIIAGKVLSPQFIIWLYPLVPLISGRAYYLVQAIFIAVALLTLYIFPLHYSNLVFLELPAIIILAIRNVLLVALFFLLLVVQPAMSRDSYSETET